ncbi:MAG: hypothetical protein LUC29_03650 [Acidaminococcaceae bacterium]|nr:hypothetical protein [Acidaminococcaceae bacterium]
MATKSIVKEVTIRNKKSCEMFVNALEHSATKGAKEVNAANAVVASVEDVKEMFRK